MQTINTVTENRDKYIGGSDIPAILGICPYKTRWELLQEKAGIIESDFTGNKYTEYGNNMEDIIREYVVEKTGKPYIPKTIYPEHMPWARANIDGIYKDPYGLLVGRILEIKTTSKSNDPKYIARYKAQTVFYMLCAKIKFATIAVYERHPDFVIEKELEPTRLSEIKVELENKEYKELSNKIVQACHSFLKDLKRLKADPALQEQDFISTDVVDIANEVVQLEKKLAFYKDMENQHKKLKSTLKEAMDKNGVKSWVTPHGIRITFVADGVSTTTEEVDYKLLVELLTEHVPTDTMEKLTKEATKVKTKKGKTGYIKITGDLEAVSTQEQEEQELLEIPF